MQCRASLCHRAFDRSVESQQSQGASQNSFAATCKTGLPRRRTMFLGGSHRHPPRGTASVISSAPAVRVHARERVPAACPPLSAFIGMLALVPAAYALSSGRQHQELLREEICRLFFTCWFRSAVHSVGSIATHVSQETSGASCRPRPPFALPSFRRFFSC